MAIYYEWDLRIGPAFIRAFFPSIPDNRDYWNLNVKVYDLILTITIGAITLMDYI